MKAKFEADIQKNSTLVSLCKYKSLRNLPHWHMEHELILLHKGSGTIRMDNHYYNIAHRTAAFIPAECIHDIVCDAESEITVLKFKLPHFDDLYSSTLPYCSVITNRALTENISTALERISSELEHKHPYSRTAVTCILGSLLVDMLRTQTPSSLQAAALRTQGRAQELLSLIETEYASITFDAAALKVGLSRTYFSEYFKEICGMTFTEYLNLIKVGEAVKMILEGGHTVTETALSCGFGCIRSFNRIFKKLTGYAPTELPSDYSFISRSHTRDPIGFDPTLPPTVMISDNR